MRIAIGGVVHETNTFSNVKTTLASFTTWEWEQGARVVERHRGVSNYLGGMIARAEELQIELVPLCSALANPAGIIESSAYETLKSQLLLSLSEAGPVDAVCLSLHGAGVVEGIDDMEGHLLGSVRSRIGQGVPLVATLDLHANVTEAMVAAADALLGNHLYPHTDSYDKGWEAMDLAVQMAEGRIRPVMHLQKLPLLIPPSTTNLSPAHEVNERCAKWESERRMLDCVFFHGFPYTDTPDVGVSVLTVTDDDKDLAVRAAEDTARYIWHMREQFKQPLLTPEEGIQEALAESNFPVIINETSDNPGGGTPGDATHLLQAMLDANLDKACFAFICDPEVVESAIAAGVGSTIEVKLGGKTDSLHGEPVTIKAYVKCITDGKFVATSPMGRGAVLDHGRSVRLQAGGLDIIVSSVKGQVKDEQIFVLHGIDITRYRLVALKSSQHFRAAFEPLAARIITVDSPGLTTLQLHHLNYQRITRPIYPLDEVDYD
ncbi:M81 family metallopeptidase [Paenibacillus senegalensis]|uniref:M81 family metallopeptidase n=1 Tax=Paenibacillus senegalensis TaxID=1465766 RepID=UPI00028A028D|nr:M81 family metallopeptidase [Paenibacillus senegalensis]